MKPVRAGFEMNEYRSLIKADLYRYTGRITSGAFITTYCTAPGFKYSFWLRTCALLQQRRIGPIYWPARMLLNHYSYKYGIFIAPSTSIGPGLHIGHCGGIVVNNRCVIGRNCNISHEVTLGQTNRGKSKGCPVIGNDVYIGPGAKVIGAITVGDNAAIGANCVVTHDVPAKAVVVGVPGKIISYEGSSGYVTKTGYAAEEPSLVQGLRISNG